MVQSFKVPFGPRINWSLCIIASWPRGNFLMLRLHVLTPFPCQHGATISIRVYVRDKIRGSGEILGGLGGVRDGVSNPQKPCGRYEKCSHCCPIREGWTILSIFRRQSGRPCVFSCTPLRTTQHSERRSVDHAKHMRPSMPNPGSSRLTLLLIQSRGGMRRGCVASNGESRLF